MPTINCLLVAQNPADAQTMLNRMAGSSHRQGSSWGMGILADVEDVDALKKAVNDAFESYSGEKSRLTQGAAAESLSVPSVLAIEKFSFVIRVKAERLNFGALVSFPNAMPQHEQKAFTINIRLVSVTSFASAAPKREDVEKLFKEMENAAPAGAGKTKTPDAQSVNGDKPIRMVMGVANTDPFAGHRAGAGRPRGVDELLSPALMLDDVHVSLVIMGCERYFAERPYLTVVGGRNRENRIERPFQMALNADCVHEFIRDTLRKRPELFRLVNYDSLDARRINNADRFVVTSVAAYGFLVDTGDANWDLDLGHPYWGAPDEDGGFAYGECDKREVAFLDCATPFLNVIVEAMGGMGYAQPASLFLPQHLPGIQVGME